MLKFFKKLFKPKSRPLLVVAKIISVEKHPNADKLHILRVDCGMNELQQIVCGAPNVRPGFVGVLARPGCVLPGETEALTARPLRGVMSCGMMCSARELGSGNDHSGIFELGADEVIGKEYVK
jgi:phenylalanyl-tRNA synthetase beta chain